jgi:hypothetical protein
MAESMKALRLLQDTVHDPEALKVVLSAFDMAWAELQRECPTPASARADERHRLATVMLSYVTENSLNPAELKKTTLMAMKGPAT